MYYLEYPTCELFADILVIDAHEENDEDKNNTKELTDHKYLHLVGDTDWQMVSVKCTLRQRFI